MSASEFHSPSALSAVMACTTSSVVSIVTLDTHHEVPSFSRFMLARDMSTWKDLTSLCFGYLNYRLRKDVAQAFAQGIVHPTNLEDLHLLRTETTLSFNPDLLRAFSTIPNVKLFQRIKSPSR